MSKVGVILLECAMISLEYMKKLRAAYQAHAPRPEQEVLTEIGNPTQEEIVATALEGLKSEDRNVRVLMLRVLNRQSGEEAMRGILAGLHDEKRRVKEVALKSCQPFLHHPEIPARLEEMVTDEDEHKKIRAGALHTLTGHGVGARLDVLPKVAAASLESLAQNRQFREKILFNLLMLDLSEHVDDLLKDFVKNGSKEEAVMATRALCGYRVVHVDAFAHDRKLQKQVMHRCELAAGRVFYWMKRDEFAELSKTKRENE